MTEKAAGFRLPRLMGHRGAAALAPENTLAGLDAAAQTGCPWVELDVMLTRDGVPVLHHDLSLERTAGVEGMIAERDLAELADLEVGRWFRDDFAGESLPTLTQAIRRLRKLGLGLNLEIKPSPGRTVETAAAAVAALREAWPAGGEDLLLSSFVVEAVAEARRLAPDIPRGLIATEAPPDWRSLLTNLGCVSLHLRRDALTPRLVAEIHAKGYAVAVFTVNDPQEAATFRQWGADCIITDAPDRVCG